MIELVLLQALRLKGRANLGTLALVTAGDHAALEAAVAQLVQSDTVREVKGHYLLLPPGRARLVALLDAERVTLDQEALGAQYERFTEVNADFKQLAADWQLRAGEPNDHTDAAHDAEVLSRLPGIHARVSPVVRRVAELAPRLTPYQARLDAAFGRVRGGEHQWLLKPLIDSYHTVWFELHEEFIGLAGRSREAEGVAGRAE